MAELQPLIDAGKPLPTFDMNTTIHAVTAATQNPAIDTHNVVGELEGSDRKLKKEFLVISAHLDHLGVGKPVDGDAIYNGAMDNASGVASVIEAAKLLERRPAPQAFHPLPRLHRRREGRARLAVLRRKTNRRRSKIVADINMDMFLPLFPLKLPRSPGPRRVDARQRRPRRRPAQRRRSAVRQAARREQLHPQRPGQLRRQGIPALAFKFGWTPDSPR